MSLLERALERNPAMIETAIALHQAGEIPSPTQIIDLDAVAENGAVLAASADRNNLRVYAMTKQNGNNPFMTQVLLSQGIDAVVALEALQVHQIRRFGFPLGAVGHLTNLPFSQVKQVVGMRPEFVSVYTHEAAKRVSDAASEIGIEQDLYVRVTNPKELEGSRMLGTDDGAFAVLAGGWTEANCVKGIAPLLDLPNVRVAGLMQFGGIAYGASVAAEKAVPTEAMLTMVRAKELLERELGLEDLHLNAGGEANAVTFDVLAAHGITEVEPGQSLTGSGSFHAQEEMPERPAQVIVTEVSHSWGPDVYVTGGVFAFVSDLYDSKPLVALAGRDLDDARRCRLTYLYQEMVDAHGVFSAEERQPTVGDTAVVVHHPQHFLERGYTAAVSGISVGEPKVELLFDAACHALDREFNPVSPDAVKTQLERIDRQYEPTRSSA